MRRLFLLLSILVLSALACTLQFQTMPQAETATPGANKVPATETGLPENTQDLEGPDINYNGIRFTLDPALGSRLYVYNDEITIDGKTAHSVRFSVAPEEYCQTWCVIVYPVTEFQQAFGDFVFPPAGYRGGAAVIFHAQEKLLHFQEGTGTRALETFGQDYYGVNNESLKYAFRGYNVGKQYAIYVQIPVRTASLPDAEPTLTTDIQGYNQQTVQSVNALTPADFTPNLDLLDALVIRRPVLDDHRHARKVGPELRRNEPQRLVHQPAKRAIGHVHGRRVLHPKTGPGYRVASAGKASNRERRETRRRWAARAVGPQSRDARLATRGAGMPALEGCQVRPARGGGSKVIRRSRARRAIRVFRGSIFQAEATRTDPDLPGWENQGPDRPSVAFSRGFLPAGTHPWSAFVPRRRPCPRRS